MKKYKSLSLVDMFFLFASNFVIFVLPAVTLSLFNINNDLSNIVGWTVIFLQTAWPVAGALIFLYEIYIYSYTLKIDKDGVLVETQIFNRERSVLPSEIKEIVLSFTSVLWLLPTLGSFNYFSPRFINNQYEVFPKYGFTRQNGGRELIDYIKRKRPEVLTDESAMQFSRGIYFKKINSLMVIQSLIRFIILMPIVAIVLWVFLR
jgi:hypothetical protein